MILKTGSTEFSVSTGNTADGKVYFSICDMDKGMSVTNNISNVIDTIVASYENMPDDALFIYRDTDGVWDGLRVVDKKFKAFFPMRKDNEADALLVADEIQNRTVYNEFFMLRLVNDRLLGAVYSFRKLLSNGELVVNDDSEGYRHYNEFCAWYEKSHDTKLEDGYLDERKISKKTLIALNANGFVMVSDVLKHIWEHPLTELSGVGGNGAYSVMRWIAHREQKCEGEHE